VAQLDKPAAAQPILESALESLDPEMVKTRPRLLAGLATAHVRQGNMDQAGGFGADALVLAERQQLAPNLEDYADSVSILSLARHAGGQGAGRAAGRGRRRSGVGPSPLYVISSVSETSGRPRRSAQMGVGPVSWADTAGSDRCRPLRSARSWPACGP
jgi:hypothetical protein